MNKYRRTIETVQSESLFLSDKGASLFAQGRDYEYDTCDNEFYFYRCTETGLLFLNPRPANSELNIIYPPDYLPYCFNKLPFLVRRARDFVQKGKVKTIQKLVSAEARILDFGCGNGDLLRLLRRYGSPDWELHANDFNQNALDALAQQGFKVHLGDIKSIDLANHFDIVILNQVIEHLGDVRGVLKAIYQLLKPGGIIFIETPSFDGLDAHLFQKGYWGGYHFPRHWYIFNARLLERLLHELNFIEIEHEYLTSPSFWVQSLHHFFLDKGYGPVSGFFKASNPLVMAVFTLLDLLMIQLGRPTSNLRVIGQKNKD
jgi:SAM-dependent methyltransferase